MKKAVVVLMIISLISKSLGLCREIVLSYFYGTSYISDAYLVSSIIPTTFFALIGVGVSTGYIPMYTKIEKLEGEKQANIYTNNLLHIVMLIFLALTGIGLIFTPELVKIFASGFDESTLQLAIKFTRITILGMGFSGIVYIFQGFLQIKGNYAMGGVLGIPLNLCMIVFIILSSFSNIIFLPIGVVIATIIQLIVLALPATRYGYRYKFIISPGDKYIKEMLYLALPVILGVAVNDINVLIDRNIASQIMVGGISALDYAKKINDLIQGVYILSISTVIFPTISRIVVNQDFDKLKSILTISLKVIFLIVIPAVIGLMIFSKEIVEIMFGRGAFDFNSILITSEALCLYSVGMLGYGVRQILVKVFYALQETKIPMKNSMIGIGINIILNIILGKILGIGGLALATSISAMITAVLMMRSLNKINKVIEVKKISVLGIKITGVSLIMGVLARQLFDYCITRNIRLEISMIVTILLSLIVYFSLIVVTKIITVKELKQMLQKSRG